MANDIELLNRRVIAGDGGGGVEVSPTLCPGETNNTNDDTHNDAKEDKDHSSNVYNDNGIAPEDSESFCLALPCPASALEIVNEDEQT